MDTISDPRTLEERYGAPRPVRRAVAIVVGVLLAGAGLGWLLWAAWVNSDAPVKGVVVSFEVVDTHRVDTRVQVRVSDRYTTGTCLLRATAYDHAIVGETTIEVDGREARTQNVALRTEREATTVEVVRCTGD